MSALATQAEQRLACTGARPSRAAFGRLSTAPCSQRASTAPLRSQQAASAPASRRLACGQGRRQLVCRAANERPNSGSSTSGLANKLNPVYFVITGAFAALLLFKNPYIYAVLTIATVLPQNSNVTSLNNLVLMAYESGLFMNFAEAVYCVRLVTWLSMGFMVLSFCIFR